MKRYRRLTINELTGIALMLGGVGLLIDLFTHPFTFIVVGVGIFLTNIGMKKRMNYPSTSANLFFYGGIILTITNLFQLFSILSVIAFAIIYIGYLIFINNKGKSISNPITFEESTQTGTLEVKPLLDNKFISNVHLKNNVFELKDLDYFFGFGEVEIDLTSTLIPEGETVLVIHGIAGNITLDVPYDLDVSIHHSTLYGKLRIFSHYLHGFNKTCKYRTENYHSSNRKVKIITSIAIGKIEVKNK
jgi:lia operon protein LiaF